MKILITGTSGFLGGTLAEFFVKRGHEVLGVERKHFSYHVPWAHTVIGWDTLALAELAESFRPEAVVHAAGGASVPVSLEAPLLDFDSGPALLVKLLDALRKHAPQARTVFLSSAAIYGQPSHLPVNEDFPCAPLSPYGYHKWMGELACREYAILHGLPVASARIFSAYGPGLRKQVVWDLCRKASLSWQGGALQGTGAESRDFLHARDVATGVECLLKNAAMQGECYNLGSGREATIHELTGLITSSLKISGQPTFDGCIPAGTPRHWRADITAIAALGFVPSISLEEGVGETVRWFQSLSPAEVL